MEIDPPLKFRSLSNSALWKLAISSNLVSPKRARLPEFRFREIGCFAKASQAEASLIVKDSLAKGSKSQEPGQAELHRPGEDCIAEAGDIKPGLEEVGFADRRKLAEKSDVPEKSTSEKRASLKN